MPRARFITLEGVEGAGKSTQLALLHEHLLAAGKRVLLTREPGGTPVAERVRELLLDPENEGMSDDAELLLVFAARADHLARRILPALRQGTWVLSDRFTDATFAYQGGGRGIPTARIAELEGWVQGDFRPDRVVVLDVPPGTGARRVAARGARDRFEREQAEFFERVRARYLERAAALPKRYRVVDARGSVDDVRLAVAAAVEDLL